ncbi:MAG: hypothetical protein HY360_17295 [Verrucomicrobia bacterium]|nr:hypothetical protein [Verrucomicrobiota bacterium]
MSHHGKIWILKPAGEVYHEPPKRHSNKDRYIPKVMPVKILTERDSLDVPAILAGIHANAYLGRGTFREITHWGNIKAIECVLGRGIPKDHVDEGPSQLLECLGSTELETLVAKLLESAGCFVEAYRGGTRLAVDVVAHNDQDREICLGTLVVKPKKRVTIQVKGWTDLVQTNEGVDYIVGLIEKPGKRALDSAWLLEQVKQKPPVAAWLRRSLRWLPEDYLDKWGI